MKIEYMEQTRQGVFRQQAIGSPEPYNAFVPFDLPPEFSASVGLSRLLSEADQAIGRLDGLGHVLPNIDLFIYFHCRREAVLSSQIEGTQSTLSELLLFEMDMPVGGSTDDVRQVSNYISAMRHGMDRMKGGFPLSLRLLREVHEILLSSGRGREKHPGEFRTSQNWIGGTRPGNATFVPPPPDVLMDSLDKFEKFLHGKAADFPVLIQAAMLHYQFETIHPFLDGNGRIGRLLIPLLLIERNVLNEPLLYPSLFFKKNRDQYFSLLQQVRIEGAWEAWIEFFLKAVASTATQASLLVKSLVELMQADDLRIRSLDRARGSMVQVYAQVCHRPFFRIADLCESTHLGFGTVQRCVQQMQGMGMLSEITNRPRNRIYRYNQFVELLNSDME